MLPVGKPASTPMLNFTPLDDEVVDAGLVVCALTVKADAANAKAMAEILNTFFMTININCCASFF